MVTHPRSEVAIILLCETGAHITLCSLALLPDQYSFVVHAYYSTVHICYSCILNHSVCTDPDQVVSEHLDKELVWNIQLLSQVHEHVIVLWSCFLINAHCVLWPP